MGGNYIFGCPPLITMKEPLQGKGSSSSLKNFPSGRMMWGKLPGYEWWPGCILSSAVGEDGTISVWIKWYGENLLSQVSWSFV